MNFTDIYRGIQMLAKSQGFYGRLLQSINELNGDDQAQLAELLEAQNFGDMVDVCLFFEC